MLKKYLSVCDGVSVEDRYKLLRFIENISMGVASVSYKVESMHGAGSPQALRIMIARQADIGKKRLFIREILDLVK